MNAGQNYEIHIPFKANPLPTAAWTIADIQVLEEVDRIEIKVKTFGLVCVSLNAIEIKFQFYFQDFRDCSFIHQSQSQTIRFWSIQTAA